MSDSSSPGWDPRSSWCILYEAAKWSEGNIREGRAAMCYRDIVSEWGNLRDLGKTLGRYKIPERTPEEILEKLKRWRQKWQRVNELKQFEAGLRDMDMTPQSNIIHFSPEAYAFHVEVIICRNYVMLECSGIVLIYFSLMLLMSSAGLPTLNF